MGFVRSVLTVGVLTLTMMGTSVASDLKFAFANAIAEFEGANIPGSVADRNKNPGNLKLAGQTGAVGEDEQGHAIFPDRTTGYIALINQLDLARDNRSAVYNRDDTIESFFQKYAEGNQEAYSQFVASRLGVSPLSKIGDVLGPRNVKKKGKRLRNRLIQGK